MLAPVRQALQGGEHQQDHNGIQTPRFTSKIRHFSHSTLTEVTSLFSKVVSGTTINVSQNSALSMRRIQY